MLKSLSQTSHTLDFLKIYLEIMIHLLYHKFKFLFSVLCRECADCGHVRIYYGSDDGVLNMKTFLVGHDVLRDYLYSFLTGNRLVL